MDMTRRAFCKAATVAGTSALLAGQLPARASEASYDVIVVGAGVIGCCCTRELMRYDLSVLVVEAGADIAMGATRANSGIVHAGYDPTPGTLKARYNVEGAKLFPSWAADLNFGYQVNGALVLAFTEDDLATLSELQQRGIENGASETFVIGQDELRELEPNVAPEAIGALHIPGSAICDPYGLTFAAAENAADNGAEFLFKHSVTAIEQQGEMLDVTCDGDMVITCRAVVNAAGINADLINNMVSTTQLEITPKKGEYHLFKADIQAFTRTIFQPPTDKGKGVLVGRVMFGNQFCGPNSQVQESRTDVGTTAEGLAYVMENAEKTWPGISENTVISNYAGLRASNAQGKDFVLGQAADVPALFNAACIDSPGLACAPAIASDLAAQVASYLGAGTNEAFNPTRIPAPALYMMDDAAIAELVAAEPLYGNEICHCAKVSEGELVAQLHRSLPVGCIEALKWRTGATMGPCQGGRCTARIMEIIVRELGGEVEAIEKRLDGSAIYGAGALDAGEPGQLPEREDFYELPRSTYRIPGGRGAGVYSARCVLNLMALAGCTPGNQAVIWGATDLAYECAEKLAAAGATVTHLTEGAVVSIQGEGRVESVTIAADDGATSTYPCDLLVISETIMEDEEE